MENPAMEEKKYDGRIKVLEWSPIYPAIGSLAPESLPLTTFDYFILRDPVQRVLFYELPSSVPDFMQQRLLQLKLSLSLALREFRPLAATVDLQAGGEKPEFRSSDGDAVLMTVAESGDDFYNLSGSRARHSRRFHPLLPSLISGDAKSLIALQITLFPGAGVALGITISHGVAGGTTTAHFLRTWAALCRFPPGGPPSHDRSVIHGTKGGAGEKPEYFGFVFDARARLKPPVPETYFGNCLGFTGGDAGVNELRGEEGIVSAWTAIWKAVRDLKAGDALKVSEDWISGFSLLNYSAFRSVAGSPRLGMYQVDFGWGAPRKVEIASIKTPAISMAEGGQDRKGVEIGLALPGDVMERLSCLVVDNLSAIS